MAADRAGGTGCDTLDHQRPQAGIQQLPVDSGKGMGALGLPGDLLTENAMHGFHRLRRGPDGLAEQGQHPMDPGQLQQRGPVRLV